MSTGAAVLSGLDWWSLINTSRLPHVIVTGDLRYLLAADWRQLYMAVSIMQLTTWQLTFLRESERECPRGKPQSLCELPSEWHHAITSAILFARSRLVSLAHAEEKGIIHCEPGPHWREGECENQEMRMIAGHLRCCPPQPLFHVAVLYLSLGSWVSEFDSFLASLPTWVITDYWRESPKLYCRSSLSVLCVALGVCQPQSPGLSLPPFSPW